MVDGKNYKKNKGNKYAQNAEFAEEVTSKNVVHPAQNNLREGANAKK